MKPQRKYRPGMASNNNWEGVWTGFTARKPSSSSSAAVYTIKLAVRLTWRSPSSSMCRHGNQLKSVNQWKDCDEARMRTRQLQRAETPGDRRSYMTILLMKPIVSLLYNK